MNGTKVTLVTTEGTFHSGMPGGPTTAIADHALLGAILQADAGDVFVKMTGPNPLIKETTPEFLEFLKKATASKKQTDQGCRCTISSRHSSRFSTSSATT